MQAIVTWLSNNLFTQTAFFMGVLVAIGMISLKKPFVDVLEGFLTGMLGYYVFNIGTSAMGTTVQMLGKLLAPTLGITGGVTPVGSSPFLALPTTIEYLIPRVVPCFILVWLVHVLLVKFVPWFKVIYLSMHNVLAMVSVFYYFFYVTCALEGIALDTVVGLSTLVYITVSPMLSYKASMEATGGAYALGWTNQISAAICAKIAPLFGDPEKDDAESIKLPGFLSGISASGLTIALSIPLAWVIVWLIVVIVGNPEALEIYNGYRGNVNGLIYILLSGVQWAAATYVLQYGLRMFLGALLPAFQGLAEKFLPNAVPGLDTVAFYGAGPNAVAISMLAHMLGEVVASMTQLAFRTPVFVIFSLVVGFNEMAAIGPIVNKRGGWKACAVCGFLVGFAAVYAAILFVTGLNIVEQSVTMGSLDSCLYMGAIGWIGKLFVR